MLFSKDLEYPVWTRCGQCLECRKMNLSGKVLQMLLEQQGSIHSQFLTLTFDPIHEANPEFDIKHKDHWQQFLKRLRHHYPSIDGRPIKYFRVGEHGGKNGRWHYHFVIFHLPKPLLNEEWEKLWKMGFTRTAEVNEKTITYVAKYTSTFKYHEKHTKYHPHQDTQHSCSTGLGHEGAKAIADEFFKQGIKLIEPPSKENPRGGWKEARPHTIKYNGNTYVPTRNIMKKFVERYEELNNVSLEEPKSLIYYNQLKDRREVWPFIVDNLRINYEHKVRKHKLGLQNGVYTAEKTPQSEKIASNPYLSEEAKNKIHSVPSLQDIWTTNTDPSGIDNSS